MPPRRSGAVGLARNPQWMCRLAFALLLTLSLGAVLSAALTVEVEAGERFAMTENLPARWNMQFQFALHPEYTLPITIEDRDTHEVLMSWNDAPHGVFSLVATDTHRVIIISLDNSNSLLTSKLVNVDLRTLPDLNFAVDVSQLDPIEQKVRVLTVTMQRLRSLQEAIRIQQRDHRATVEDSHERVLLWSAFQVVAFLTMTAFQLYMLKRLLERKTYV